MQLEHLWQILGLGLAWFCLVFSAPCSLWSECANYRNGLYILSTLLHKYREWLSCIMAMHRSKLWMRNLTLSPFFFGGGGRAPLLLEVNKCVFTHCEWNETNPMHAHWILMRPTNARGPLGRVHWTSIKDSGQVLWFVAFPEQK